MKKQSVIGSMQLLLTAIIWGVAFVAQSEGMNYVGPYTFNCVRSILGGVVLIPCIWFLNRYQSEEEKIKEYKKKDLILGGICCGICLCMGTMLQQFGIQRTTVGKAGFITALYIIFVPIVSIFLGKKPDKKIWICVLLAIIGLYYLCINDSWALETGDIYLLIGAIFFTMHILVIDYFAPKTDNVKMSCIQFFVAGICCIIPMLVIEKPQWSYILDAKLPILYAGILSSGVAYTLQIIGQKKVKPTIASLIMSAESVVSVIAGWLLLNEELSTREIFGCVIIFIAILLAQFDMKQLTYKKGRM
jgi:drug/metabolite transporter (DMT)-like permease